GDVDIDTDRAELPDVTEMPFAPEQGIVGQKPGLPLAGKLSLGTENPGSRPQGVSRYQRVARVLRLHQYRARQIIQRTPLDQARNAVQNGCRVGVRAQKQQNLPSQQPSCE